MARPRPGTPLTGIQRQILERLSNGEGRPAIARALCVSEDTINTHSSNILVRLGTHRMEHAVTVANARGDLIIKPLFREPTPAIYGRELQILVWVSRGMSTAGMAKELGLTEGGFKYHLASLNRELNAVSRPHLVYRGYATANTIINR